MTVEKKLISIRISEEKSVFSVLARTEFSVSRAQVYLGAGWREISVGIVGISVGRRAFGSTRKDADSRDFTFLAESPHFRTLRESR
jgi:hypothetical protein